MPIKVDDPREIQSGYEDEFNSAGLHSMENASGEGTPSYDDPGVDGGGELSGSGDVNGPTDAIRDMESTSGYINNFTGGNDKKGSFIAKLRSVGSKSKIVRRAGPVAALSGVLVAFGIGASMLLSPSMLFVHLKEVIVDRFNISSTALDIRTNKILTRKLASTATSGCGKLSTAVPVKCKYSKMTKKMLKSMSDQGLVAYDKSGNKIDLEKGGDWDIERPAEFRPTDKSGFKIRPGMKGISASGKGIEATGLTTFLKDNPSAAVVFRRSFNVHWTHFWDSTATSWFQKIGFGAKGQKIKGEKKEDVEKSVSEAAKSGEDKSLSTVKPTEEEDKKNGNTSEPSKDAPTNEQVNELLKTNASESTAKVTEKIKGAGKGVGVGLLITMVCMARNAKTVGTAIRVLQLAPLISFGLKFIQVADEIKAGRATPGNISSIGSTLTDMRLSTKDGSVMKKSAMESDGVLYALANNTSAASKTSSVKKYIPGSGAISFLHSVQSFYEKIPGHEGVSLGCDAMESPVGQAASLFMNLNPVGIALTILTFTAQVTGAMDTLMAEALKALAGNLLKDDPKNEDLGNAMAVGMVSSLGEGANAGSMMPLSVDDAIAYGNLHRETQLANAQIDRAEYSPFDATNPNTMMGSLLTAFTPYFGMIRSGPLGVVGATSGVVGSTFSSLINPSVSAAVGSTAEDYKRCGDPSLTEEGIAAGMLCEVAYGIPVKYLNSIDPIENVEYLTTKGSLDDKGEIKADGELDKFIKECSAGDGSGAVKKCMIDSSDKARYALYKIDSRIQKNMDGEETYAGGSGGGSVGLVDPSQWAVDPNHDGSIDKNSEEFKRWAADLGGNGNTTTGVLQAIPGGDSSQCTQSNSLNQQGGGNLFNPNAAAALRGLIDAFNQAHPGKFLKGGACFRSYAGQVRAKANHGGLAATPGKSNHGWGLAVDLRIGSSKEGDGGSSPEFGTPDYEWLTTNSPQFGWVNPKAMRKPGCHQCEAWHFQYVGPLYGN